VVAAEHGGGERHAPLRGATIEDIRAAHRRLITKVHPDAGGSAGLATRVNAARDALIAELKRQ
jgi:DnaJ family protein C protein 19